MRFHVYPLDYSFKFEAPVRTGAHRTAPHQGFSIFLAHRTAPHHGFQNLSGHRTAPAFLKAKPAPHRTAPGEFWKIWNPGLFDPVSRCAAHAVIDPDIIPSVHHYLPFFVL